MGVTLYTIWAPSYDLSEMNKRKCLRCRRRLRRGEERLQERACTGQTLSSLEGRQG